MNLFESKVTACQPATAYLRQDRQAKPAILWVENTTYLLRQEKSQVKNQLECWHSCGEELRKTEQDKSNLDEDL